MTNSHQPVTASMIAEAMDILAEIIARDGPATLPVYERLEREYQAALNRSDSLSRALARAGRQKTGNVTTMRAA